MNDMFDNVIMGCSDWSIESLSGLHNSNANNLSDMPARGLDSAGGLTGLTISKGISYGMKKDSAVNMSFRLLTGIGVLLVIFGHYGGTASHLWRPVSLRHLPYAALFLYLRLFFQDPEQQ